MRSVMLTFMMRSTKGTSRVIPACTNRWYLPSRSTNPLSVGLTIRSEEMTAYRITTTGIIIARASITSTIWCHLSLFLVPFLKRRFRDLKFVVYADIFLLEPFAECSYSGAHGFAQ